MCTFMDCKLERMVTDALGNFNELLNHGLWARKSVDAQEIVHICFSAVAGCSRSANFTIKYILYIGLKQRLTMTIGGESNTIEAH